MDINWTYDPGENAYVDIKYDNHTSPLDWNTAWLQVRGSATEFDIWPDPIDHSEYTRTWNDGPQILQDAYINAQNRPEKKVVYTLQDGGNHTFEATFYIILMNP
jgi:hypothetical protein